MTAGRMIAVVGPSGAGKDSLIAGAIAARPDLVWAKRVITRPSAAGGEPYDGVTQAEFAARKASGQFVLDWHAHGLSYGIPASVLADLAAGRDVIFNGSRAELAAASRQFPDLIVVLITASTAILAQRLAARGREAEADIAVRLARATFELPPGIVVQVVENEGSISQGVARFLAAIQPARA
jgi:ribose 1,5-bisphosphokinase